MLKRSVLFVALLGVASAYAQKGPLTPPSKPLILGINVEPKAAERALVEADPAERERLLKAGKYDVREFKAFVLVTPHDLLHLEAAKTQASLLARLAARAAEGERAIDVDALPEAEGQALRERIAERASPSERAYADAPGLKLRLVAVTTFQMRRGDQELPLRLLPRSSPGKDDTRMKAQDDAPKAPSPRPDGGPKPTGRLTFLLPPGVDGTQGMEWISESQAALLGEMRKARDAWSAARDALRQALEAEIRADYGDGASSGAKGFADLKADRQHEAGQFFGQEHGRELGGLNPEEWLAGASTVSSRTEPLLEMGIAVGKDTATTHATSITLIPFAPPVGP